MESRKPREPLAEDVDAPDRHRARERDPGRPGRAGGREQKRKTERARGKRAPDGRPEREGVPDNPRGRFVLERRDRIAFRASQFPKAIETDAPFDGNRPA